MWKCNLWRKGRKTAEIPLSRDSLLHKSRIRQGNNVAWKKEEIHRKNEARTGRKAKKQVELHSNSAGQNHEVEDEAQEKQRKKQERIL